MKTRDPQQLAQAIKRRIEIAQARMVAELAQVQVQQLRKRAERGVGLADTPMPAYTRAYARRKQGSGRQVAVRDLTWSGRMLGSLVVQLEGPRRAKISFADAQSVVKARAQQKRARWFGVSPADRRRIIEQARAILGALLKGT